MPNCKRCGLPVKEASSHYDACVAERESKVTILAIDPGNKKSGWCLFDGKRVIDSGVMSNTDMIDLLVRFDADKLAIEAIASYGMAVGAEVFETCIWVGRFFQEWKRETGEDAILVYRKDVKMHLCGTMKAKDSNIRQALIDAFPATSGGKAPQIGTKSIPGPLYGVSSHAWSALAVAVTAESDARRK